MVVRKEVSLADVKVLLLVACSVDVTAVMRAVATVAS